MNHLTHIIFDLDETLYPRNVGLLQEINQRISLWLQRNLDLSYRDADALRAAYFRQYGTTLSGLVAEHQVDPDEYLTFVHDVPPDRYLAPNPALAAMLSGIPLQQVVFTNGPSQHGRRVLQALGLADHFEQVIGIQEVGLTSKPHPEAYLRLLALLEVGAKSCVLVEDRAVNLLPAKRLGMTTILVDAVAAEGVDYVVEDVLAVGPLLVPLVHAYREQCND